MNIIIYIFIGIITFGILYCGYWMYIKLSTADTRLLQLVNEINRVKTDLRASKNELSSAIKSCRYLITNTPDSGSSKNKDAKKYGVEIITERDFLALLGDTQNKSPLFG